MGIGEWREPLEAWLRANFWEGLCVGGVKITWRRMRGGLKGRAVSIGTIEVWAGGGG